VIAPCYRLHSIDLHHHDQTQLPCAYSIGQVGPGTQAEAGCTRGQLSNIVTDQSFSYSYTSLQPLHYLDLNVLPVAVFLS
jgi:hypothetical protein